MIECSVNNITKYYGANLILKNISFEIKSKERIGLIGQNGCGKTTIMKMIMGSENYKEGSISIRKGSKVGYLDQIPNYEESLTVLNILNQAFEHIFKLKKKIDDLTKSFEVLRDELLEKAMRNYSELVEKYERLDGYNIETKINKVTSGLKIDEKMKKMSFTLLSGGEKTRVILAKILLEEPDILMLDEPSNHLDMESIEWLEGYLKDYKGAILIISHDRYFLDNVVNKVVELELNKANVYHGNYTYYNVEKERRFLIDLKYFMNQEKKIKNVERQIERYRIWGVMRDSDKMFKRAKELEKRLEKMERVEKPVYEKQKVKFNTGIGTRSGKIVLQIENLSKSFDTKQIFNQINFNLFYQERVCIIGKNGTGKSTLLKMILSEIPEDSGNIKWGSKVNIGYLPQNVIFKDDSKTLIEYFQDEHNVTIKEARNALAKALFFKDDVYKKIKSLSGGEKSKLKLCSLMERKVNVMILDEPTNHLDIDSREVLENILVSFDGTILFVSHDRYFISKIADKIVEIIDLKLNEYIGDYNYYKQQKQKFMEQLNKITIKRIKSSKKNEITKKIISKEKRIKESEIQIQKTEERLKEIDSLMETNGYNMKKLNELYEEKMKLQKDYEVYFDEWEDLQNE